MSSTKSDVPYVMLGSALSAGSAFLQRHPRINEKVSEVDNRGYVPVRWRRAVKFDGRPDDWLQYPPSPSSGPFLPASFKKVAEMSINKDVFRAEQQQTGGLQAVAYRLGHSVAMVGVFEIGEPDEFFGNHPERSDRFVAGLRIGQGALHAAMGIYNPEAREFKPLHDHLSPGNVVPVVDTRVPFA